jgi:LPS O-antigen subunit length determinant protein (WzzB/FepE family)
MDTTESQQTKLDKKGQGYVYPPPYLYPQDDSDEINLLEYIYVLVKNKWWIIGATVLGLVLGYVAAIKKGPTWISEAVISSKESDNQKTPNLSGLGAFGGMVASQLNIAGSPGLDKIDLILDSRKFNAEVIEKYNLLPLIYKVSWPKTYKVFFDTVKNEWASDFVKPNLLRVGGHVKKEYLKKETSKNNTMTIQFESSDSLFSDSLLGLYLIYLNDYIKKSVQTDANENVKYLETQLITASDPLLREKLQGMIANEMEKTMLVSKEAFKIVDPKLTVKRFKEKRLFPLVLGFGFFFLIILAFFVYHAFKIRQKSKEDQVLIEKIKKEIKRI